MQNIKLALKFLLREWRSGELYILVTALIIAVAALSSISFYTDRVAHALNDQAIELLGGKLVVNSSTKFPTQFISQAQANHLNSTQIIYFPTVAVASQQLQLVDVKAVTSTYPLAGNLRTKNNINQPELINHGIPSIGTIWVDARLLSLLNVTVGSKITIGVHTFNIAQILTYEPDVESNVFTIAPRVLMNQADIEKTEVIQPGSRVTYSLLLTGDDNNLRNYKRWLILNLNSHQRILGLKEGRPQIQNTLQNAENFMHLAVVICVVLSGIAIGVTARRYAQRHAQSVALLRCLGLKQRQILNIYFIQFIILGIAGSAIGCVIGYFSQLFLAHIFSGWFNIHLPAVVLSSILIAIITGLCILLGFTLAPLMHLKTISPMRILSRELHPMQPSTLLTYAGAIAVVGGFLLLHTENWQFTLLLLYGIAFTVLVLYWVGYAFIHLTHFLTPGVGITWRYGITNLARRSNANIIQLIAFGLIIMTSLLLYLLRNDLIQTWQQQVPANAPNYFAINIEPDDVSAIQQLLSQKTMVTSGIYPMVRGRLITLNGKPIKQAVPPEQISNNALNRELNLSWTMQLPSDNKIVQGSWWTTHEINQSLVSMEVNLANALAIKKGDVLGFQVGDKQLHATVYSLRSLRWDSFHPNFYMIFPPGVLDKLPATYITSFYLSPSQKPILTALVKQFPSITIIDIAQLLVQTKYIISSITKAIKYILIFTFIAGLAILYASLQVSLDERLHESAIMRALGASRKQLRMIFATEFIVLGLLAGLLGSICATLIAWLIAYRFLDIAYTVNYIYWFYSVIIGGCVIGIAGLWGVRSVIKQSPLIILRENQ